MVMQQAVIILVALLAILIAWLASNATEVKPGAAITVRKHYSVNSMLLSPALSSSFVKSAPDAGLLEFLEQSRAATNSTPGVLLMLAKSTVFRSLQRYLGWTRPDASGFLSMASLYVGSEEQFRSILPPSSPGGGLLDVGSGTGSETAKIASALSVSPEDVTCLESSVQLQRTLRSRGFRAPDAPLAGGSYSAVSLLNVLDRCDDPHGALQLAIDSVAPGGTVLVASVLPFSALVHEGKFLSKWSKANTRKPLKPFKLARGGGNKPFEEGMASFLATLAAEHPRLELERWTRLPYVSSGDTKKSHYIMDMALMAFKVGPGVIGEKWEGERGGKEEEFVGEDAGEVAGEVAGEDAGEGAEEFADKDAPQAFEEEEPPAMPEACRNKKDDKLFSFLATTLKRDAGAGWGDVLDAGGGFGSLCWLLRQSGVSTVTEVTAATDGIYGSNDLTRAAAALPHVSIEAGNWRDPAFLPGRTWDVVVADYLLGAVEMHWPHGADGMMDRLLATVKPGGYLLISGLEPYEFVLDMDKPADRLVLDVESIGESAAFIAGESTYREIPMEWVVRQIERFPEEFRVVGSEQFVMKLSPKSLTSQIKYAKSTAKKIRDPAFKRAFLERVAVLEKEVNAWKGVNKNGRNYGIVVQRKF